VEFHGRRRGEGGTARGKAVYNRSGIVRLART
jgi:hypothetical protein